MQFLYKATTWMLTAVDQGIPFKSLCCGYVAFALCACQNNGLLDTHSVVTRAEILNKMFRFILLKLQLPILREAGISK